MQKVIVLAAVVAIAATGCAPASPKKSELIDTTQETKFGRYQVIVYSDGLATQVWEVKGSTLSPDSSHLSFSCNGKMVYAYGTIVAQPEENKTHTSVTPVICN